MESCYKKHRYTIGIAIGVVYALASSVIFILSAVSYYSRDDTNKDSVLMVASTIAFFISGLFIIAVVKKWHHVIYPWFILNGLVFIISCCVMIFLYLAMSFDGVSPVEFFGTLFVGACIIGIEIAVFLFSCQLYGDIEIHNAFQLSDTTVSYRADNSGRNTAAFL